MVFAPRSLNIDDLVQGEHPQISRGIGGVDVLAENLQYLGNGQDRTNGSIDD